MGLKEELIKILKNEQYILQTALENINLTLNNKNQISSQLQQYLQNNNYSYASPDQRACLLGNIQQYEEQLKIQDNYLQMCRKILGETQVKINEVKKRLSSIR